MGGMNLMMLPLYIAAGSFGFSIFVAINAAVLISLHEIGKNRRPGSNAISAITGFFSSQAESTNAYKNIINGGAHTRDEFVNNFFG